VCTALVAEGGIGTDLSELPIAAAAPEAMSEKAITIGLYAVASGVFTAFMPGPRVQGSRLVREYLEGGIERETGGRFLFTDDVEEAVQGILAHLDRKRAALKLAPMLYQNGVQAGDGRLLACAGGLRDTAGSRGLGCGHQQLRSQARPPQD